MSTSSPPSSDRLRAAWTRTWATTSTCSPWARPRASRTDLASRADRYFRHHRPDAVVLVDYPGFNWWIARRAKVHGIPVFYYAPPQIWAWAQWRVRKLRRLADCIEQGRQFRIQVDGDRIAVPAGFVINIEHERGRSSEELEFQLVWPVR